MELDYLVAVNPTIPSRLLMSLMLLLDLDAYTTSMLSPMHCFRLFFSKMKKGLKVKSDPVVITPRSLTQQHGCLQPSLPPQ